MTIFRLFSVALACALAVLTLSACELLEPPAPAAPTPDATLYTVTRVIDGDTIDVERDGQTFRVRYIGINTPERDEPCFREATEANRALVAGRQVRLERDVSDTDRFDRLLRYVYVGEVFVNEALVRDGWAEAVLYEPDRRHWERFRDLEIAAARAGLGCHPTGVFDDGTFTR